MTPEEAHVGLEVRVCEDHRIAERRGMEGTIVARYGGEKYTAREARFSCRELRLFWPEDLEEIFCARPRAQAWWRALLRRSGAR